MSSAQASLFEQPAAPKRVRETSKEAYRDVLPTVKGRQLAVLKALSLCQTPPTSSELMRQMCLSDPNSVRPRLTELSELRYVEASERPVRCSITGKNVHAWHVTQRGMLFLRGQR